MPLWKIQEGESMRDKLVELIDNNKACDFEWACCECKYGDITPCFAVRMADALIANDVTIQRWIPVDEAKPKLIPNTAGTAYSDAVNALTSGRKVITAIWDGTDFIGDAEFWEAEDEIITHWTPVLLPLPEPPKENANDTD